MADGRLHCYLCPRHCHIGEGQHGFCFIRKNEARTAAATRLRPACRASRWIRSRRSRSTISSPARRSSRWAPPAATWAASSARTGTSPRPSPTRSTRSTLSPEDVVEVALRASRAAPRVHLQRADHLGRVRHRHRARGARRRPEHRDGLERLHHARGVLRHLSLHRRRQHRPESVHRRISTARSRSRTCSRCSTR